MEHTTTNITKRKIAVAAVVVTSTVGLSSAYFPTSIAQASDASSMSQSAMHHEPSQASIDLRVGMNNLLREHVTSSLDVTRALADNAPERQVLGAEEAQYLNSDALAAAVGSVYGGEAQAQFSMLFREHIKQSNMYAKAVGNGDQEAKHMAQMELQEYLTDLSAFFAGAIPGLPQQDVYGLLNEHEELINKSTEAYHAGDFVQSYQLEREATKQASRIADALSSGIIATQPDKF